MHCCLNDTKNFNALTASNCLEFKSSIRTITYYTTCYSLGAKGTIGIYINMPCAKNKFHYQYELPSFLLVVFYAFCNKQ